METSFDEILRISRERATKKVPEQTAAPIEQSFKMLELSLLSDFPNHKFPLYSGKRLEDMLSSVKHYGILEPLIVWQNEGTYTIISGHNRKNVAMLLGMTAVPCTIKTNLTMDEAKILVGETNLRQRSFTDMSYSERAFCLAEHYNAIKKQGTRTDLIEQIENPDLCDDSAENRTCGTNATSVKNRNELAEKYNLSPKAIHEYVHISSLNSDLLFMLDNGICSLKGAYQLSFINNSAIQQSIADALKATGCKLNPAKGTALRKLWDSKGSMTEADILNILNGVKKEKMKPAVIKPNVLKKYFPQNVTTQEVIAKIIDLLEADRLRKEKS